MEEDINYLKDYIERIEYATREMENYFKNSRRKPVRVINDNKDLIQAIKNVLHELEYNKIQFATQLREKLDLQADSISKSKVEEKIEEYKKRKQDLLKLPSDCGRSIALEDCDEKIALYQELLGEEK